MKNIYYLLSGTDKKTGFYDNVKTYLQKDISSDSIITFIASDFDNFEINDIYYDNMIRFFNDIDINFKKFFLIDSRIKKDGAKKLINNSNIIYIMGGIPNIEMENIKKYDLIEDLKRFKGIIIGVSAGSINMNKTICYEDNRKIVQYKGIGLLDFNIAPHYDLKNSDYINEIIRVSKFRKTIALPNESFIRCVNNKHFIIGDYYIYEDGKLNN